MISVDLQMPTSPCRTLVQTGCRCTGKTTSNKHERRFMQLRNILATVASITCLSTSLSHTALAKNEKHEVMTVRSAMNLYADSVRKKLSAIFQTQNVSYPPKQLTWIALKEEKLLLVFAKDIKGAYKQILSYPIIGASGVAGPKLKEGDKQVPEGFYKIDGFRPNVIAHLGLAVNYPNAEDKLHAKEEKRTDLGKDILIHGSKWSTGCLAMGNEPIEELFVLAHDSGCSNIQLIFSPCNLTAHMPDLIYKQQPSWLPDLYKRLKNSLQSFPINTTSGSMSK